MREMYGWIGGDVRGPSAGYPKADVEPLIAALRGIAKNTCCDRCTEAGVVARDALRAAGIPLTDEETVHVHINREPSAAPTWADRCELEALIAEREAAWQPYESVAKLIDVAARIRALGKGGSK